MNVIGLLLPFAGVLGLLVELVLRFRKLKEEEEQKENARPKSAVYNLRADPTDRGAKVEAAARR